MNKEQLYILLQEMTPGDTLIDSVNRAWHSHRRAEQLSDAGLLDLLREIIEEHNLKKEKEIRRNAYFVMSKLLLKTENREYAQFLVECLNRETDRYVLGAMLDGIGWLKLPPDVDIAPVIACGKSEKWLIRHSAIYALRASDTEESREALRCWLRQEDEKKYKFELIYANAAMGVVGRTEDIRLLEKHASSRIRDIRDSANFAIEAIRSRTG